MKHIEDSFFEKKHREELKDLGYTVIPLLDDANIASLSMLHEDLKKTVRHR